MFAKVVDSLMIASPCMVDLMVDILISFDVVSIFTCFPLETAFNLLSIFPPSVFRVILQTTCVLFNGQEVSDSLAPTFTEAKEILQFVHYLQFAYLGESAMKYIGPDFQVNI